MVDHVVGVLETQSQLVGIGPVFTIVIAPRSVAPKLFVDDASHDLAFSQVMCIDTMDQAVASTLLPILLLKASAQIGRPAQPP